MPRASPIVGLTFQGNYRHILKEYVDAVPKIANAAPAAVRYGLQPVVEESQRLVPVMHGYLKDSLHIREEKLAHGTRVSIIYGFGNRSKHYAVAVHERPDAQHARPTQWQYLRDAWLKEEGNFKKRVEFMMFNISRGFKPPPLRQRKRSLGVGRRGPGGRPLAPPLPRRKGKRRR